MTVPRGAALIGAALLLLGLAATDAVAPGGLATLPPIDDGAASLVANGGFEDRTAKWSVNLDGGVWAIDAGGRSGNASLRLTGADRPGAGAAEQAVDLEPGFYTIDGWARGEGLGAGKERSGVRICLDGRPRRAWWKCTALLSGTRDWTRLAQPVLAVTLAGRYRVSLQPYNGPAGRAWFDDVRLVPVHRPPLDVFLLYPNFRGYLFDDRPQIVRAALSLTPGARRPDHRVIVRLLDEAGGAARAQREYPAAAGRVTAELDATALPPGGTGLLRAELVDAKGEVLHRAPDYRVVKAPAAAREKFTAWIDEDNVAVLGGRRAFVMGLYNTTGYSDSPGYYARGQDGWGDAKIAEAPVNMLINYHLGAAPVAALTAYMDDLIGRGIFFLHTVNFYYRDAPLYTTIPHAAARVGEEALHRWIASTLGRHRGLAGFYTADERPADMVPRVFRQRRELAKGAPGTVTYAVLGDGWEEQAPLWRDAVDVMGLDPYPLTRPPGQNDLAMVGDWTRLGRDAVMGARPVWMVIQFFPQTVPSGWPRYEDLRAMSWMAITDGAHGLFYWSFGIRGLAWVKDPAERARHWSDLVRVTKEIKALEPVLLAPDARVATSATPADAVGVRGKRLADGTRYLFVYNRKNAPTSATWTLAAPAQDAAEVTGGAPPTLDGRTLTDTLAPYETKRYRLK